MLEAEITGSLEHPGIVPIHGLGQYADGRPFYAMRLIKGESLAAAADRFHKSPEKRFDSLEFRQLLGRFIAVCNAVAYAHSRGVLHRDLKPANIMLGKFGETLVVDWGLAKAGARGKESGVKDQGSGGRDQESGSAREATLRPMAAAYLGETAPGKAFGTPAFMSPEQASGATEEIGPASDIYSLGATLYTLLTNRLPVEGSDLTEIVDKVKRGQWQAPRVVNPSVPAALDAICRKAMALRPEDRYATALELAADLERWLADEPVAAYPERWRERARRWLRRHRPLATSAAALLVAAAAALGLLAWQSEQGRRRLVSEQAQTKAEQERAERNAKEADANYEHAKAVLTFFQDKVLAAGRPEGKDGGLGKDVTLRKAIDVAQPGIAEDFRHRPLVEAAVRDVLGTTYYHLGERNLAIREYGYAFERLKAHLGPDHPGTLASMNNLANAYQGAGQLERALPLLEQALAKMKEQLGPDHPETLTAMNNLAMAYQGAGQQERALPLLEQTLAKMREGYGPDHPDTLTAMNNLAMAYQGAGQREQALLLFERGLEKTREQLGPDHPDTLLSLNNLAEAYRVAGRPERALPLLVQALAKQQEKLGADHPDALASMNNLALAFEDAGQPERAVPLYKQALAKKQKKLGPDHASTLTSMNNLAQALRASGQPEQALPLQEEALERFKKKLGPDHPSTLTSLNNLAMTYKAAGQLERALPLFEQVLAKQKELLDPDHPHTLSTMHNLALAYQDAGQLQRALPLLEQTLTKRRKTLGSDHPHTVSTIGYLGVAYLASKQPEKALPLQREFLALWKQRLGADDPRQAQRQAYVARDLLKYGQSAEAEPILRECLAIREKKEPEAWTTFHTCSMLGTALLGQQKYAEAEPLLVQGYEGLKQREAKVPKDAKARLPEALDRLVELYDAWGKPKQAAAWRAKRDELKKAAERLDRLRLAVAILAAWPSAR
jgi:hypothetical protein